MILGLQTEISYDELHAPDRADLNASSIDDEAGTIISETVVMQDREARLDCAKCVE